MILESKRHLSLCAAAVVCGILAAGRPGKIWLLLCVLLLAVCVWQLFKCRKKTEAVAVGFLLAVTALASFLLYTHQERQYQIIIGQLRAGTQVQISGTVCRKEIKEKNYLYYLKHSYYKIKEKTYYGGSVILYYAEDVIPIGAVISASGEAETFAPAANEGNFDAKSYYRAQNITFRVFVDEMQEEVSARSLFRERLYRIQKRVSNVFAEELNERDAGILCTLVLGSKAQLEDETKQMYQSFGISHILAISGLHISFIGLGIYRILRKCRCSCYLSAGVSAFVTVCFALMSGFGVSAKRALFMYLILIGAQVIGRTYDAVNALALALLLILLENPAALLQNSFLFSFTAMISILATTALFRGNGRQEGKKTFWQSIYRRLLTGGAIQIWMLPLTAWFYYEVPVYAFFLNLLVIPLCGWLLGLGLVGGMAGLWFPVLSKWLLVFCHFILNLYDFAMEILGLLPGNRLMTGQPSVWFLFFYYLLLCCVYLFFGRKKLRRILGICAGVLAAVCLSGVRQEQFRIDFLDVGQGDGICISDGRGGHVFLDGGSSSEDEVGKYRLYPFLKYHQIKSIFAWIVTHGDEDHISGLLEVLEMGYPVEHLFLAEAMPRDEAFWQLVSAAEEAGSEITYIRAGDEIQLSGVKMICLYPDGEETEKDRNALSQVWLLEGHALSALFTGDIGEAQERKMQERGLLVPVDILKAAHHGSKTASSELFLHEISPELTVISCSVGNRYGHPHAMTLKRLAEIGSKICQTKEHGQITVKEEGGRIFVEYPCAK